MIGTNVDDGVYCCLVRGRGLVLGWVWGRCGRGVTGDKYREYNPDSAGTQRDECLVETHVDRFLWMVTKILKWFRNKLKGLEVNQ